MLMTLLHYHCYGQLAFVALQFLGATGLAWKLPRNLWPLRYLCAVSALADIVEAPLHDGTNLFAIVYWLFRIFELNLMVLAVCKISGLVIPTWRFRIWSMFAVGIAGTLANGLPHSNTQMHIYQTFMLMLAGGTGLFIAAVGKGFRAWMVSLAASLMCALQLACTLIWRYIGYDAQMWFVAWITGLALLAWSVREEQRG